MATYYSSPGSERDLQNMYSRDPGSTSSYQMPSALGNLLYLNNPTSEPYTGFSGILQLSQQQNCMDMAGPGHHPSVMSQDSSARGSSDMLGSHLQGQHTFNNSVKDMKNEMLVYMMDGSQSSTGDDDAHNGAKLEFGVLNNHSSSNVVPSTVQGQGLSLSLNTQILAPCLPYSWSVNKPDMLSPHSYHDSLRVDDIRMKSMQSEATRAIRNSRYLKAAQELLDEVVNVWKNIKLQKAQSDTGRTDGGKEAVEGGSSNPKDSAAASAAPELSTAEKKELQNKMAKLMAMSDEVDRKYKHYYHQMQTVVSSFDVAAGPGAAKPYTTAALQTISRHFRCLKDAINDQMNVMRKKLGEEESTSGGKEGSRLTRRLRYIDQQLRQQRAFHQYGLMPQNAWRPQRGLPENSVTVLRAWLFEHFLHPYPKDSEKLMLSRQTGLTRSQISNWFINARVRLWKPMIEDMYKEEIGDVEQQDSSSSSDNNASRSKGGKVASQSCGEDKKEDRPKRVWETTGQQLSESSRPRPRPSCCVGVVGTAAVNVVGGGAPVRFQQQQNNPDDDDDSLMNLQQMLLKEDHHQGSTNEADDARFMAYHHLAAELQQGRRYAGGNVSRPVLYNLQPDKSTCMPGSV